MNKLKWNVLTAKILFLMMIILACEYSLVSTLFRWEYHFPISSYQGNGFPSMLLYSHCNPYSSPLHLGGFTAWEATDNAISSTLGTANVLR